MRKIALIALVSTLFLSCSKNSNNGSPTGPGTPTTFINNSAGSTWSYHETNSSTGTPVESDYTVTSTNSDTTIQGKAFHVYSYSFGGFQYLNQSSTDYYQYDSIPGISSSFVRLFLKTNLDPGQTWDQNINVTVPNTSTTIPVVLANKIADKNSRTVNGINYQNVIHVQTTILAAPLPAGALQSAIDTYYAQGVGLIESSIVISINYLTIVENVNIHTTLASANLK